MSVLQGQVLRSSAACRRAAAERALCRLAGSHRQQNRFKVQSLSRLRSKESDDTEPVPVDPLLGALTTIGLSGTIAVVGSTLCGYQIFSTFKWDQPADVLLALQISGALVLLEALLFLPSYSIPASLTAAAANTNSSSSSSSSLQAPPQQVDMAAVKAAGLWSSDSWLLLLALYRAVLRRPQVEQLPQQVRLGLLVARETSKELLQRGFVLFALARWITDRCYEAGLDDSIALSPGGLELSLTQVGLWAASLVATALFAPAAFVAAEEAAESVSGALLLRTDVGQALAAGSSSSQADAGSSSSSSSSSRKSSSGGQGDAGSSSSSSSSNSSSSSSAAAAAGSQQQAVLAALLGEVQDSTEPQQQYADAAEQQADDSIDDSEEDSDDELDPLVLEYRLFKVTEECVDSAASRIAYGLTLSKELTRIMLANVSFVATGGNLAATWAASLVMNSLLLAYAGLAASRQEQQQQRQ